MAGPALIVKSIKWAVSRGLTVIGPVRSRFTVQNSWAVKINLASQETRSPLEGVNMSFRISRRRKGWFPLPTLPGLLCPLLPPATPTPMLAATTASLPPPLRRARLSTSHGGGGGVLRPLRPRPRRRALACRADLQHDAPFAAAIGACVLASLVLPTSRGRGEEEEGEFGATDTRMGVMGMISFLPYFNWLSWVFAWLDTGKRRYLFYAAAYLAPYLRTNLSLSPEESWLPIASIFACILHVQLESSIRSGDIETFTFVQRAWRLFFPSALKEKDAQHRNKGKSIRTDSGSRRIPSAHESREKLRNSDIFKRRLDEPNDEKQNKSDWN
ncbi:hypothetical protein E2562_039435 [Oryza meyeriana var. granulata]|uniref:Uncharacterized protein n=1 Tax=Oryza meyeriana var. granulata TaxID=110450 RepID=A0A6G1C2Q8_9ORYZ|nr:hypothetical protein E2562_039435 [Oryza meyeriana var. granulata]